VEGKNHHDIKRFDPDAPAGTTSGAAPCARVSGAWRFDNVEATARDTWKLLLRFVSERKRREIAALSLADLGAGRIIEFLQYLEDERKVSVGTRNCRLADCGTAMSRKDYSPF
jgi:hypothetical protein